MIGLEEIDARQALLLAAVLLALMIDGVDTALISLIAPLIVDEWGVSKATFGVALSAALVGMTAGAAIGGRLGSRYGSARAFIWSILWFGATTVLAAATGSVEAMASVRFASGLGFGAATVNGFALAADWFPPHLRPKVTGLLSIAMPLGMSLCALTIKAALSFGGWRASFVGYGLFTLLVGVALWLFLPRSRGPAFRDDAIAASEHLADRPSVLSPSLRRLTIGTGLLYLGSAAASYGFMSFSPMFLTMRGFPLEDGISASFWVSALAVASALAVPLILDRVGSLRLLIACNACALAAVAFVAIQIAPAGIGPPSPEMRTAIVAAIGASGGFTAAGIAVALSLMTVQFPAASRPAGLGFGIMMGRLGGFLMLLAGGALLTVTPRTILPMFVVIGLCSLLGMAAALIVDRHIGPRLAAR